jgi:hypothetical protein
MPCPSVYVGDPEPAVGRALEPPASLPCAGARGLIGARAEFGGQFLRGGLAAQLSGESALNRGDLADGVGHVNRDSGGPGLAGHRSAAEQPDGAGDRPRAVCTSSLASTAEVSETMTVMPTRAVGIPLPPTLSVPVRAPHRPRTASSSLNRTAEASSARALSSRTRRSSRPAGAAVPRPARGR